VSANPVDRGLRTRETTTLSVGLRMQLRLKVNQTLLTANDLIAGLWHRLTSGRVARHHLERTVERRFPRLKYQPSSELRQTVSKGVVV